MKTLYTFLCILIFSVLITETTNAQYCSCTNLGGACITNTTFGTINYSTVGCTTNPGFYTATGLSTPVIQGQTYVCTVTNDGAVYGSGIVSIWIDWDLNNVYDTYEWYQPYTAALTGSINITVPIGAVPGPRGMRVRSRGTGNQNTATDACLAMGSGETEDYVVNVISATPCTGTPVGGLAVANPLNPCPGVNVNVNLTGSSLTANLAYQWLKSTSPLGPWIIMGGATNPTLTVTPAAGTTTFYRCRLTCITSGFSDTSAATNGVVIQAYSPTSPCYCPCTNQGGACITEVSIGSLTNSTLPCTNAPTYYNMYNAPAITVPNLTLGNTYTFTIVTPSDPSYPSAITSVWIDWNHNTVFEPSEWTQVYTAATSGSVQIPVPTSALVGQTRMRVRSRGVGNQNGAGDACLAMGSGETEDYVINVIPAGLYDPTISSIVAPVGNLCIDSFQTLSAQICNYGSNNINLALHPMYITYTVIGPLGTSIYLDTLNTGTLNSYGSGCQTSSVYPVNMFAGGNYSINAQVTYPGLTPIIPSTLSNDSLFAPINILNYRPTAGPDYPLCQFSNTPFGQGLTVGGCSAPISDSVTITFSLTPCIDNVGATTTGTGLGPGNANCNNEFAGNFANAILPALPTGAFFTQNAVLTVDHLTSGFPTEMRFILYSGAPIGASLYAGCATGYNTNAGNIVLAGQSVGPNANFTNTRHITPAQLSSIFGSLSAGSTLNIGYWETWNDLPAASDIGTNALGTSVAKLKIYYQYVPPAFAWYDVPVGGTSLYAQSPFDPLSHPNALVNNSNTVGNYTFYAACAGLPTCRVPVHFVINETPMAVQDTFALCEYALGANSAVFDLTTIDPIVSGNNLAASVSYYGDQALLSPLVYPTHDTSSTNFIYSKVYYASTGCYSSDSVYLVSNSIPEITIGSSNVICAPDTIDILSYFSVFSLSPIDTFYYADAAYTIPYPNPHAISVADSVYIIVKTNNGVVCADSNQLEINISPATNDIALQNNLVFPPFSDCNIVCNNTTLLDGNTETISTGDCRKIATVTDAVDGVNLGVLAVCEEIDCTVQTHLGQPYLNRHYEITPANNDSAYVCLYYLQQDFDDFNAASASLGWPDIDSAKTNLCITKVSGGDFNTPGHTAIAIPTAAITSTYDPLTTIWTVCFPVSSFSYFYCHSCNYINPLNPLGSALAPLPVTILNFTGKQMDGKSQLKWTTSSERNNSHFILERSKDAKNYFPISNRIPTKAISGNSNSNLDYNFTDATPFEGHNYYRLKQVDIDGNVSKSKVVDVYFGNETMVSIYPNPVNTELNVDINASKVSTARVKIMDATGKVVRTVELTLEVGTNSTKIDLESLSDGVYMVNITSNNGLNYSSLIHKK